MPLVVYLSSIGIQARAQARKDDQQLIRVLQTWTPPRGLKLKSCDVDPGIVRYRRRLNYAQAAGGPHLRLEYGLRLDELAQ